MTKLPLAFIGKSCCDNARINTPHIPYISFHMNTMTMYTKLTKKYVNKKRDDYTMISIQIYYVQESTIHVEKCMLVIVVSPN